MGKMPVYTRYWNSKLKNKRVLLSIHEGFSKKFIVRICWWIMCRPPCILQAQACSFRSENNRKDDLGARSYSSVRVKKLRHTKNCSSFWLISLISEHIMYKYLITKHSSDILKLNLLQISSLYLLLIFF